MDGSEDFWRVIYTASRQEKKLAGRLKEEGVLVYLPLYRKLSQWSDRKKWIEWPLFSGYLFVKPTEQQRDEVLRQPGALSYLRFNGRDAFVTEREIETIENILRSGYSMETISTPDDFKSGDEVLIVEGPLRGQKVDVLRRDKEEIFLVAFHTLGQRIKIQLPFQIFKKI
jgi:transcription antitermination factor NusG